MGIQIIKTLLLLLGFKIVLFCFSPLSSTLVAQRSEDSVSVVEDLTPDEVDEPILDEEVNTSDKFIKKEQRVRKWQPASQRNIPEPIVKNLKEEDAFWYADKVFNQKKKPVEPKKSYTPLGQQRWFKTLIWIIIIGAFIAFLVTYLSGSNINLFRKKNVIITNQDSEEMPEDIFAINYQKEIDKAAAAASYRLAVRLMFLHLLKNLSERNIINYKQDKTNFDYLSEVHSTSWYQPFFKVTRNYEYSWYGKFEINEDAYRLIQKDFDQFKNQLR
ncbi:MAG: hypothetical protein IPH34_12460 [Chitinophagaceae bacterium]|nr:hypothetical protein [Chitinophagaceae bacterium]